MTYPPEWAGNYPTVNPSYKYSNTYNLNELDVYYEEDSYHRNRTTNQQNHQNHQQRQRPSNAIQLDSRILKKRIGAPSIYEPGHRPAYRMIKGSFFKQD